MSWVGLDSWERRFIAFLRLPFLQSDWIRWLLLAAVVEVKWEEKRGGRQRRKWMGG